MTEAQYRKATSVLRYLLRTNRLIRGYLMHPADVNKEGPARFGPIGGLARLAGVPRAVLAAGHSRDKGNAIDTALMKTFGITPNMRLRILSILLDGPALPPLPYAVECICAYLAQYVTPDG